MVRLSLSLLGAFQASLDGKPITGFGFAKVRALLAFLAVETDHPHRRESLAALLWPDQPDAAARNNLRNALSSLRKAIGDRDTATPVLLVTRETVQFDLAGDCWVDVQAFRKLCQDHDAGHLTEAIGLYRGHFLEGFTVKGCVEFDDWSLLVRDRLHRQASIALQDLVKSCLDRGDLDGAQKYAWHRVELEPWREDAHQQLIRILGLSDQRTLALTQYEACREILLREFDVAPSPATQRLYEAIREGAFLQTTAPKPSWPDLEPDAAPPPPQPTTTLPHLFVARERELERLATHLALALTGKGRVVFVTGEAGQGKTALIQAFVQRALKKHPDLIPACGNCNAYTGVGDPYLPFREIFAMLAGDTASRAADLAIAQDLDGRLLRTFPITAQVLQGESYDLMDIFVSSAQLIHQAEAYAQRVGTQRADTLLSELRTFVERKGSERAHGGPPQEDLFRQYVTVLKAIADKAPLLLVVDDLQWADLGSLSLLFHLGRELGDSPIFILGAYRSEEVALGRNDERHPLESVVHEFGRLWGDISIDLGQAEGRRFVEGLVDAEPNELDATFRSTLHSQTQGHPLFTVELLRGMQERGDLIRNDDGAWVEGPVLNWQRLPERVEAVIAERIDRLDKVALDTLRTAAVEGEVFTAEVLAVALNRDTQVVISSLSGEMDRKHRLVQAQGLSQAAGKRLSRYRFRHILFQKYLYGKLDPVEHAHLHGRVGTALESVYTGPEMTPKAILPQLAWHAEQAGRIEDAINFYEQAGNWAVQVAANEEAYGHFNHALKWIQALPEGPARDQQELDLQLAIAAPIIALRSWGAPEAGEVNRRAVELSEHVGTASQRMRALSLLRGYHNVRSEHNAARALAEACFAKSQQSGDLEARLIGHYEMCVATLFVGEFAQSLYHSRRLLTEYDPEAHQALAYTLGQDLSIAGHLLSIYDLWYLGYPDQALQHAEAGVAYATKMNHPFSRMFVECFKSRLHRWRGEVERVDELADAQMRAWTEHAMQLGYAGAMLDGAWVMSEEGHPERAIDQYKEALSAWLSTGMANHLPEFWAVLAQMYAKANRFDEALDLLENALDRINETGERYHEAEVYRLRGEIRRLRDRSDAATPEADFRRALEIARNQQAKMLELRAAMSMGRLWLDSAPEQKRAEGFEILANVYGWFTEGFGTKDLQEAKALLDALA